ncbi:UTRA domain-containing protein [Sphingobium sp. YR768]|uniref:UTRA domain-containing protein n=1 Tax=Sphingobium sp. YR768 TaxID=1884365 RepID=UPI0008AC4358|nr:UTRA domain-containing protein [Sphingobium sp. YR768]SER99553.1 transcriptional regulator, GntR family [Sphingobium sp. YR768]
MVSLPAPVAPDSIKADDAVAAPELDGKGPLWLQIRRALANAILSGGWPAGTRVPSELVLTAHYATSRMTVHKAIQSLATEGLVQRRTRLGTLVTERARERPVIEIWDPADAVRRGGGRYGYRLIERETYQGEDGGAYRAGAGDVPILRIVCLHLFNDRPFQLEERFVNLRAAAGLERQPLDEVSPGQWLLAHVALTDVRHRISARGADARIAAHLDVPVGEACLVVERRTWNEATQVTLGRFWYPGEDHELEGAFRPAW